MMVPLEAEAEAQCGAVKYSQSDLQSRDLSIRRCQFRHWYQEDWSALDTVYGHGERVMAPLR